MILKALYDYYYRLKAIDPTLAPSGFKKQEIPFLIVIDKNGSFIRVEDRRIDGNRAQTFQVVADSRSGTKPKPYLMYDNLEYTLGWAKNISAKTERNHKAFITKCTELSQKYKESVLFKAIVEFYNKDGVKRVMDDREMWSRIAKQTNAYLSFLLEGTTEIAAEASCLKDEVLDNGSIQSICLVTGNMASCIKTTKPIHFGEQQSGSRLVSFKEDKGYDSYNKKQCYNAPISTDAEDAIHQALTRLLDKESRNKYRIGNRTFVFWASNNSEMAKATEECLFSILSYTDDPNRLIDLVRESFKSIFSGKNPSNANDVFYVMGLAPNNARIAVVYWSETPIKEIASKILQHFKDMEIVNGHRERGPYYGLYQMMSSVTFGGDSSKFQPNLIEATIKSILQGSPYPYTLFASAIRRIRAEQVKKANEKDDRDKKQIVRMAIIKAYLNRLNNNEKKISIMLDKENTNPGYVCGRLFAVLEYSQKKANDINTIKERYMNSASAAPAAVFATLLNLNVHHIEKISNPGTRIHIENMKQDIISMLPSSGFPAHLDLQDQGRFFVGYYHQMQNIYTKKETTE